MRRTVRVFAAVGPTERLGTAIAAMPVPVRDVLAAVAARDDLALAAGTWGDDGSGCLVANAVACVALAHRLAGHDDPTDTRTLDVRMLDAFPQMSSRDLNTLIVAWDEATTQAAATDDPAMRALLRKGLAWAGVPVTADTAVPAPSGDAGARRGELVATR